MAQAEIKSKVEQRFVVSFPVQAEWDEEQTGRHIVTEGTTEYIGPAGAVVHLQQLPSVGSHITISVQTAEGVTLEARAEVLRLVRDAAQPLASLNVLSAKREWRGKIWEHAGVIASRASNNGEDGDA
jgi:hypothetical protein